MSRSSHTRNANTQTKCVCGHDQHKHGHIEGGYYARMRANRSKENGFGSNGGCRMCDCKGFKQRVR